MIDAWRNQHTKAKQTPRKMHELRALSCGRSLVCKCFEHHSTAAPPQAQLHAGQPSSFALVRSQPRTPSNIAKHAAGLLSARFAASGSHEISVLAFRCLFLGKNQSIAIRRFSCGSASHYAITELLVARRQCRDMLRKRYGVVRLSFGWARTCRKGDFAYS